MNKGCLLRTIFYNFPCLLLTSVEPRCIYTPLYYCVPPPEPGVLESCHPARGVIQPDQDISLTLVTAEGLEPTSSTVQVCVCVCRACVRDMKVVYSVSGCM